MAGRLLSFHDTGSSENLTRLPSLCLHVLPRRITGVYVVRVSELSS